MKPTPYRGDDPFIFVSYAHDDADRVYAEIDWLTSVGFKVFYDEGISPGHSWHDDLAHALEKCHLFLFFVTPRSVASKNCLREVHFAEELEKPLLIVDLEEAELTSGLKLSLGDQQAIRAFELEADAYRDRIRDALSEVVQPVAPAPSVPPPKPGWSAKKTVALVAGLTVVVLGFVAWDTYQTGLNADYTLLADAEALVQQDRYGDAFLIARELRSSLGGGAKYQDLWDDIVVPISPQVSEPNAIVFMRPFDSVDAPWTELGQTPLADVDAPRGVLQLRVEKSGFDVGNFVVANPGPLLGNEGVTYSTGQFPRLELSAKDTIAPDMVYIPRTFFGASLQGTRQGTYGGPPLEVGAFTIARTEVTNHRFHEFVRDGGYRDADLWRGLPLRDGGDITLAQVGDWFVDTTGRSAPAIWELGTYPAGEEDLPVGGISWYEANAYARYRGAQLPTAHHWSRVAQGPLEAQFVTAPEVSSAGNYERGGPREADQAAMGPWGTLDMAGNVREWVWNDSSQGRLIMGGSWLDYPSIYQQAYSLDPSDRSPQNGVRLMQELSGESVAAGLTEPIQLIVDMPDMKRQPVSDAIFEGMRYQFTHVGTDPTATSVEVVADYGDFVVEEVTLGDGSDDSLVLYIGLPKNSDRPLQSLIYMGTLGAFQPTPNREALYHFESEMDFLVRAGRALIVPIWSGGHARYEAWSSDRETRRDQERRRSIAWYQDAAKAIDYLETREDFATDQVTFIGFSYGAIVGPLVVAVEDRFKAAVLISGGVLPIFGHPMYDLVNYLPRITQPVLYVTGRFDPIFPYETTQLRFFDLLGTPSEDKEHVLFDDLGHFGFPRHRFNRAIVDWLDQQFGPVR